ncbi:hypothetical protein ALC56_04170 [Trachymyrmex septentrionalis]|uniref:Uncharacterized protein n=1 Tax=Trachymyrmex septentrionalis TaxID=34720 RepID=A0A151K3L4_9HYME|nr:hypothetical protein ALC56_04170 [Trachymyrmex septentrionalis]
MIKTLQIALAPLLTIGSFCGVGLFEYPLGHPRPYLSCLYILAIWSFFTYYIYYPLFDFIIPYIMQMRMAIIVIVLTTFIKLITAITTILISIFYFKVKVLKCTHSP